MMAMALGGRWGRFEEETEASEEASTESDANSAEVQEAQVVEPSEVRTENNDYWEWFIKCSCLGFLSGMSSRRARFFDIGKGNKNVMGGVGNFEIVFRWNFGMHNVVIELVRFGWFLLFPSCSAIYYVLSTKVATQNVAFFLFDTSYLSFIAKKFLRLLTYGLKLGG